MIRLLIAAALLPLAGCTPATVNSAGSAAVRTDAALDRAELAYAGARAVADVVAPWLSAEQAAAVSLIEAQIERALAAARAATTLAEQMIALEQARAAMAQLSATAAP